MAFIVDPGHVMTCCHVVNDALARKPYEMAQPPPESRIAIRFPFAANTTGIGKVSEWGLALPRPVNVSVLELERTAPPTADIAVFSDAEVRGEKWSCIGWDNEGVEREVQGEFGPVLASAERQLNGSTGVAARIAGGYCGALVWAEAQKAFVGMVVNMDRDQYENGLAYAIPTRFC
jgi:hypothetical protein